MTPLELATDYLHEGADYAGGAKNFADDAERALQRGDFDKASSLLVQAKKGLENAAYRIERAQEYIEKAKT